MKLQPSHFVRALQWFPAAFSSNGCIYIKDHDDVPSSNFCTEKFVYLSCKFLLFDIITMKLQPSHFVRVLLRDISRFRMWISRFPMISSRVLFEWRYIYIYKKDHDDVPSSNLFCKFFLFDIITISSLSKGKKKCYSRIVTCRKGLRDSYVEEWSYNLRTLFTLSSVIYPDFECGFRALQWFPAAFSSNGRIYKKDHDDVPSSNFCTEKFVYLLCKRKFFLFNIMYILLQFA